MSGREGADGVGFWLHFAFGTVMGAVIGIAAWGRLVSRFSQLFGMDGKV